MNKVYIFDVDGTLTPSRRPMTDNFENFFQNIPFLHVFLKILAQT